MNLVSRTTEYPNGTKITETFEPTSTPYDQNCTGGFDSLGNFVHDGDTCPVHEDNKPEPYEIYFNYDGLERVVQNPRILRGARRFGGGWNVLLGGVETYRDGEPTGEYKNFSLDRILPN